jgi:hypothetical protein
MKILVAEFQRKKIVVEFQREKFGRKISVQKIWL